MRLCLVCPICLSQLGAPVVVAALRGGRRMTLCDHHLKTAFAVELSVKRLIPASDALGAPLEAYGVKELSSLDPMTVVVRPGLKGGNHDGTR